MCIVIESYMGRCKTGLSNPRESGDGSGHKHSEGSDPSLARGLDTPVLHLPMKDSFSCIHHAKCTCYKEKTSKSRETFCFDVLTTFDVNVDDVG